MKGCDDYRNATVSITSELRSLDHMTRQQMPFIIFHTRSFHVAASSKVPVYLLYRYYMIGIILQSCIYLYIEPNLTVTVTS